MFQSTRKSALNFCHKILSAVDLNRLVWKPLDFGFPKRTGGFCLGETGGRNRGRPCVALLWTLKHVVACGLYI